MTSPLRILALNHRCLRHPQAGGSEVNLFEQARRWVAGGHHVTVICADPGRSAAPVRDEMIDGIRVVRRGNRVTLYLWAAIYMVRNSVKFDRILDIANGVPFFSPLVSRIPATLQVHHIHGRQWFDEMPKGVSTVGHFIETRLMPWLYRNRPVIAVSPSTRDELVELSFDPKQVKVIYNGTEFPAVALRSKPGSRRILYLGRLKTYKRVERLIEAVASLRNRVPGIQLDIAGDGDTRPELESLIVERGLTDVVTIHGFITDEQKAALFEAAAVYATPSSREGWGLGVIEANAYGCPAVAFNVPGLCSAIRHGETGFLANSDSEFAGYLAYLLEDEGTRDQMADSARRWAGSFSWDTTASQTLALLSGLDASVSHADGRVEATVS